MSALSDPPTMAFLCRTDLNLSAGKLAVQCAHAAVASLQRAKKTHSRMVQRWKESASRKICLAVDDEEEIEYFLNLVQEEGAGVGGGHDERPNKWRVGQAHA